MATFTSNINRVTGLSGIDTESMIEKMMKAESAKYERLEKQKTSVTWKQEGMRALMKSIQGFQDKWLNPANLNNNIGFNAFWNNHITSVKDSITGLDSSVIKINSSNSTGKFEIEVKQQAQTESIAGQGTTTDVVAGKPSDVLKNLEKYKELSINVNLDGATQEIKIKYDELNKSGAGGQPTEKDLVDKLNEKLKDAFGTDSQQTNKGKVEVSISNGELKFEPTGGQPTEKDLVDKLNEKLKDAFGTDSQQTNKGKVEVSISNGELKFEPTGNGHNLTISDSASRTEGVSTTITEALKEGNKNFTITIGGTTVSVDFDPDKHKTQEDKLNAIYDKLRSTNGKDGKPLSRLVNIERKGDDLVIKNRSETNEIKIENANVTDKDGKVTNVIDGNGRDLYPTGSLGLFGFKTTTNVVSKYASLSQVFGDKFNKLFVDDAGKATDEIKLNFGGNKEVIINKDDSIQSLMNKINSTDSGVKLEFNDVTNRFTLSSSQSGANGKMNITDKKTQEFLKNITGIDVVDKGAAGQVHTAGQDAVFVVDGVETTRATNDITMNGINFTINGIGKVKVGVESDVDATVKKVKEFIDDYNKLIDEINKSVVEKRPKSGKYGYFEPLTDEEKKGMSEDEIKKYEENAKKGLLHGDEHLNRFLSQLRSSLNVTMDFGGKTISLYEIGITTTPDYNDGGKIAFDEEKFRKALKERGDDVRELFTNEVGMGKIFTNTIKDAIGTSGKRDGYLRKKAGMEGTPSAGNNDLTKELEEITKRLTLERERLYNKEMHYFDLFAKMESAMMKQNNQMAMILGMTGQ